MFTDTWARASVNSDFSEALRRASGIWIQGTGRRVVAMLVSKKVRGIRLRGISGEASPDSRFIVRETGFSESWFGSALLPQKVRGRFPPPLS